MVDSSSDGTGEVVARDFPQVRLVQSPGRLFPGDARNRGIAVSPALFLAFVGSAAGETVGYLRGLDPVPRYPSRPVSLAQ